MDPPVREPTPYEETEIGCFVEAKKRFVLFPQ